MVISLSDCNRRELIALGCMALGSGNAQADDVAFWNSKPSSAWSAAEIGRLMSNSPWAKQARAEMANQGSIRPLDGIVDSGPADHVGSQVGGIVNRPGSRRPPIGTLAFYGDVTVRWESAEPLLPINGLNLRANPQTHYAISVTGLPYQFVISAPTGGLALFTGTSLSVSGRSPERPDSVRKTDDRRTLLFSFPNRKLRLRKEDKSITFAMALNGLILKAKFDPREMLFHGALAV